MIRSISFVVTVLISLLSIAVLPVSSSASDTRLQQVALYSSERLSDLVNGGAPVLLDYGHRQSATYIWSDGGMQIHLEEHQFETAEGAWGYFSLQLPPEARPERIPGTAGAIAWREAGLVRALSKDRVLIFRTESPEETVPEVFLQINCQMPAVMPELCRDEELAETSAFPVYLRSALHLDNALPWLGTMSAVTSGFQEGALVRFSQDSDEINLGILKYQSSRYSRRCLLGAQLLNAGFIFDGEVWKHGSWSLMIDSGLKKICFRLIRKR